MSIDAPDLRPLMTMFWSSKGWRDDPELPADDELEQAVAAGVMFREPIRLDHDGWVAAVRTAVEATDEIDIAQAFVASLDSRRLDLRSALGSFAVGRHLPDHSFDPHPGFRGCGVCGVEAEEVEEDLNVLSFERFKWGGVRRVDIRYVAFDLQQFASAPRVAVTDKATAIARELIDALDKAGAPDTVPSLAAAAPLRVVTGNKAERRVLLEILGVCGVLKVPDHPSFADVFVDWRDRDEPDHHHHVDTAYPSCWWRGEDGVDHDVLRAVLPALG